jgi:hypothetical protein
MSGHHPHEISRQAVEIATGHLITIPPSRPPDLFLGYPQLRHLGADTSADMSLFLGKDAGISEGPLDSVALRVVGEARPGITCSRRSLDQATPCIRSLAEVCEGLLAQVPNFTTRAGKENQCGR